MNRTMPRIVMLVVLAILVQVSFLMLQSYGVPTSIRQPRVELSEMPVTFGTWQGEDAELDPQVTGLLTRDLSTMVVSRLYKDADGHVVTLHSMVRTGYIHGLPHHPNHCYQSQGSQIIEEDRPKLELDDGTSIPVHILSLEYQGQRSLALYWYQLGDKIILDGQQQRKVRWSLRGKKEWPPVVKVLLSSSLSNQEKDRDRLMEFAKHVYTWTREIDRQPVVSDKAG